MAALPGRSRDLRTLVFTDIVGSTERAVTLGDAQWSEVLRRHRALVRSALRRHAGSEMDTAGDGFFATFARPTDAIACGTAIVREATDLDLRVRVGVHAGEVEFIDGKAGGVAVHVAARLMAAAEPDEVLVSATVRELVAGAGFVFADRGALALKGLAEPVRAYTLAMDSVATSIATPGHAVVAPHGAKRWFLAAGAAVAVLALGTVGWITTGGLSGGGGSSPRPGESGSPSSVTGVGSDAPSSPATAGGGYDFGDPSNNGVIGTDPGGDSRLAAGRYAAPQLPTPLTLTLGSGWSLTGYDTGGLGLARSDDPNDFLGFGWVSVIPVDACADAADTPLSSSAPEAQYVAWLTHTPTLQVTPLVTRYFGTLVASQADVSVVPAHACPFTDPPAVFLNHGGPEGSVSLKAGIHYRFDFATLSGRLLLIDIEAPSDQEFQAFNPAVESVLDTIVVGPQATPSP